MDFHELTFYLVLFKMLSCNMSYVLPDNFPKVVAVRTEGSCAFAWTIISEHTLTTSSVEYSHSGNLSETQFTADKPSLMCSHAKWNKTR